MLSLITYKVRSENGYGFLRPGLKTGVGNGIFGSGIESGFGDAAAHPARQKFQGVPLPPPRDKTLLTKTSQQLNFRYIRSQLFTVSSRV